MKHFSAEGRDYLIASSQVRLTLPLFRVTFHFIKAYMTVLRCCYFVCFMVQIFVWTGGSFTLLQTLDFQQDILSVTPFTHATVPYLLVCIDRETASCLLLQWTSRRFENPQPLKLTGRAIQVETVKTRAEDTLMLVVMEGNSLTSQEMIGCCYVYLAHWNNFCIVYFYVNIMNGLVKLN